MTPFQYKTPIQIRFKDIDRLGHVNSAVHLTYFESARVGYFKAFLENNLHIAWPGYALMVAKVEMEYKQQILMEDNLFAKVWVSRLGTKSFDMILSLVKEVNGTEIEVAKGLAVIVCFNMKIQQSVVIPEEWKERMIGSNEK